MKADAWQLIFLLLYHHSLTFGHISFLLFRFLFICYILYIFLLTLPIIPAFIVLTFCTSRSNKQPLDADMLL